MNPIFAPWLVECVILSARSFKRDHRPPLPSEFVATFVVFGTMSLVANRQAKIATAFSWGVVIATGLNLFEFDTKLRKFTVKSAGPATISAGTPSPYPWGGANPTPPLLRPPNS